MGESDLEEGRDTSDSEEEWQGPKLPWGIRKKVIQEAPAEHHDRPVSTDEVFINFVAKLKDGTKIGSSKDDKKPFTFIIGQKPREVVEGLELGVQTMRKGEIAEFVIAARYAYDDLGQPPLVPPDATLVFEVELLKWSSKVDLFNDGRAVKTILHRGVGEVPPRHGQDVLMSIKVIAKGGAVLEEHSSVERTVGQADFETVPQKIVSQALTQMVEGEHSSVFLRRFADDMLVTNELQGAKVEVELLRIHEANDVSQAQDGSLVKTRTVRGAGSACPREASRVRLLVEAATDGADTLPGFGGRQTLEFGLGDGDVCDALEFGAAAMLVGERATLTCHRPSEQCVEGRLGLTSVEVQRAVLHVELLGFEGGLDAAVLSVEEKLASAAARKAVGGVLFQRRRHALALERYSRVVDLLSSEEGAAAREVSRTCELNRAACLLRMGSPAEARAACDRVLREDPDSVKALYRRAAAHMELSDYAKAQPDLARVLKLDPKNAEARNLGIRLKEAQRRYAENARSTAARMCGAPEPPPAPGPRSGSAPKAQPRGRLAALLPCLPCLH